MLNPRQKLFCQLYVENFNATDAALRAGYSKKTATAIGAENLRKPYIQDFIEEIQLQRRIKADLTEQQILEELKSLGFYSIKTFILSDNTITKLSSLTTEQLRPVVGIRVKETITGTGKNKQKEITTELKLADKRAALMDLGRHLGIFEKDNNQKKLVFKVTRRK